MPLAVEINVALTKQNCKNIGSEKVKQAHTFEPNIHAYFHIKRPINVRSHQCRNVVNVDLVYKLRRVRGIESFFSSGTKICKHLRRRTYEPVRISRNVGLVFGPLTILIRSFLEHCILTYKGVGTTSEETKSIKYQKHSQLTCMLFCPT